jgi:hypothetical protein
LPLRSARDRDDRDRRYRTRPGERSRPGGKAEDLSHSRDDDNRSMGSLDELDATPDMVDESMSRSVWSWKNKEFHIKNERRYCT